MKFGNALCYKKEHSTFLADVLKGFLYLYAYFHLMRWIDCQYLIVNIYGCPEL